VELHLLAGQAGQSLGNRRRFALAQGDGGGDVGVGDAAVLVEQLLEGGADAAHDLGAPLADQQVEQVTPQRREVGHTAVDNPLLHLERDIGILHEQGHPRLAEDVAHQAQILQPAVEVAVLSGDIEDSPGVAPGDSALQHIRLRNGRGDGHRGTGASSSPLDAKSAAGPSVQLVRLGESLLDQLDVRRLVEGATNDPPSGQQGHVGDLVA